MDNSRFNDLPAEVRNRIWELTITENHKLFIDSNHHAVVTGCQRGKDGRKPVHTKVGKDTAQQPGITRTCKQIRDECLLMFYAKNDFHAIILADRFCDKTNSHVVVNRHMTRELLQWLDCIPSAAHKLIPRLTMSVATWFNWQQDKAWKFEEWSLLLQRLRALSYRETCLKVSIKKEPCVFQIDRARRRIPSDSFDWNMQQASSFADRLEGCGFKTKVDFDTELDLVIPKCTNGMEKLTDSDDSEGMKERGRPLSESEKGLKGSY